MFTDYTYQDWLKAGDRPALLLDAIRRYRLSDDFIRANEANLYYAGENEAIRRKTLLRARKLETRDETGRRRVRTAMQDVVGNRIGSNFLRRFVCQQNHFLLCNGVDFGDPAVKAQLGPHFDHRLEQLGLRALLHGVSYAFWNTDHVEILDAAAGPDAGFFGLLDEMTGRMEVGVQFWQIARRKPMYVRLFTREGVTLLRMQDGRLIVEQPERPYTLVMRSDALGDELLGPETPASLPIVPLYGNSEHRSELTSAIKAKIDAYDNILSDLADNLDRANDVYWVLNNFGGTTDDIAEMLEQINRIKAVANISDGTGSSSTAEPHTIEVPYEARCAALRLLEKALYADYMALDLTELTGGSLTNVAIRAATANLHLKADGYEWELCDFLHRLTRLIGHETTAFRFKRETIGNASETVADIAAMRGDIDRRTALLLNPYIQPEEVEALAGAAD